MAVIVAVAEVELQSDCLNEMTVHLISDLGDIWQSVWSFWQRQSGDFFHTIS